MKIEEEARKYMQDNLRKLHDRKERGKLHGSGDDR